MANTPLNLLMLEFIIFLGSHFIIGIKKKTPYSHLFLISIICYAVQGFFNLSVVIVTPLFWLVMGIHCFLLNENKI